MDYRIKSDAAAIAGKIIADAGSAALLKTALLAVAGQAGVDDISEADLMESLRGAIPEESTSERWREYRLDEDIYRRKVVFHNLSCGCEIFVEYFIGNTHQYIVAAGFATMFGGGREYCIFDGDVNVYRVSNTRTRI